MAKETIQTKSGECDIFGGKHGYIALIDGYTLRKYIEFSLTKHKETEGYSAVHYLPHLHNNIGLPAVGKGLTKEEACQGLILALLRTYEDLCKTVEMGLSSLPPNEKNEKDYLDAILCKNKERSE